MQNTFQIIDRLRALEVEFSVVYEYAEPGSTSGMRAATRTQIGLGPPNAEWSRTWILLLALHSRHF